PAPRCGQVLLQCTAVRGAQLRVEVDLGDSEVDRPAQGLIRQAGGAVEHQRDRNPRAQLVQQCEIEPGLATVEAVHIADGHSQQIDADGGDERGALAGSVKLVGRRLGAAASSSSPARPTSSASTVMPAAWTSATARRVSATLASNGSDDPSTMSDV